MAAASIIDFFFLEHFITKPFSVKIDTINLNAFSLHCNNMFKL